MEQRAPSLTVRHVLAVEYTRLRELRLRALAGSPEAFGSTYTGDAARPVAWWQRWARSSEEGASERTFVVVDREDRWLGMALARLPGDEPGVAWLGGMWISPDVRGRGGARLLCEACSAWAQERRAKQLLLGVVVDNDVARRAYAAAGFETQKRRTHSYDGRSLEELVMSRALRDLV